MNASFHDDFVRSITYLKLESMQSTGKLGISLLKFSLQGTI